MAGVDALLNLLLSQGAECLRLAPGEVPVLTRGEERTELSMPPLADVLFRRFADEVQTASSDGVYSLLGREGRVDFGVVLVAEDILDLRRMDRAAPTAPAPTATGEVDHGVAAGRLASLVARALEVEAVDLFLSTSTDARLRVVGDLEEISTTRCTEEELLAFVDLNGAQRDQLESHGSVDLSLEFEPGRVRANVFRHQDGLAAVLRPIRRRIRSLSELGLPADLRELVEHPDGLVLMVGPTGSGKSSTMAALVEHLNQTRTSHILTIEDPIEFAYEPHYCLIHQREVGRHVESFAAGLRAALREGPDLILVGEMRDPETVSAALTAAETGHLVLSTLHSGNAAMAVDRIIDAFPPHQQSQVRLQLASVLRAIVTQVLVPSVDPGRFVAAIEKAIVTHGVAAAIREGRGHQMGTQIQTGRDEGMVSLELSLADLVRHGEIRRESALAAARNPELLRSLLAG